MQRNNNKLKQKQKCVKIVSIVKVLNNCPEKSKSIIFVKLCLVLMIADSTAEILNWEKNIQIYSYI